MQRCLRHSVGLGLGLSLAQPPKPSTAPCFWSCSYDRRSLATKRAAAAETAVEKPQDPDTIPPPKTVYDREKGLPMGPTVWGPAGYQTTWIMSDWDYHPEEVLYRKELFRTKKLFLNDIMKIKKPLYERELDRFKQKYSRPLLEAYHQLREQILPTVRAELKQALKQRREAAREFRTSLPQPHDTVEQHVQPLSADQISQLGLSRGVELDKEMDALLERWVEHKFEKLSTMLNDTAMEELLHQPTHIFDYTLMEEEMWDELPQYLYARGFDHTLTWWQEDNPRDLFWQDVQHWHRIRDYRQTFHRLSRYGLRTMEPHDVPVDLHHPDLGPRLAPSQQYQDRFKPTSQDALPPEGDGNEIYELASQILAVEDEQQRAAELPLNPNPEDAKKDKAAASGPAGQTQGDADSTGELKADLMGTLEQSDLFMAAMQLRDGLLPTTETTQPLRELELYRQQLALRIQNSSFEELLRYLDPSRPAPTNPRDTEHLQEVSQLSEEEQQVLDRVEQLISQARQRAFLDCHYDVVFSRRYTLSARIPSRPDVRRLLMLRHRRVKLTLNVDCLQLPPLVMKRFRELAGVRYNPASRILTITSDQRETYWQNFQRAKQLVRDLLKEAYLAYPRYLPLDELQPPAPRLYEPMAPLLDAKPIDAHILFRLRPRF